MRKVSWKNPARTLFLGLLIVSASSFAGYSNDPDCKAVSDSARNGAAAATSQIDQTASATGTAISTAKSCVDKLLEQYNRSVPDFGGGIPAAMSGYLRDFLTQKGCNILDSAQSAAVSSLPSVVQPVATGVVNGGGVVMPALPTPAEAPGIWGRIAASVGL